MEDVKSIAKRKGVTILAHNYQRSEVQDVADFIGDSLELSIRAMEVESKIIVFAGVDFMAEQASILNPNKIVLHPDVSSRCPMAQQLTPHIVKKYRSKYEKAPLIVYVNSLASVKAMADYIVTSSSAVKLVSQIESDTVLFGPDVNLASYVAEVTGKNVIPIPKDSFCYVHKMIKPKDILRLKDKHPKAKVIVHPECTCEVRRLADFIGSTSQMVKAIGKLEDEEFIIGTEVGIIYRILKTYPNKKVYPALKDAICIDMKKITIEKILHSIIHFKHRVLVENSIAVKVRRTLERSFELIGVEIPWLKR